MSARDNTKARACAKIKFDSQVLFGFEAIRTVLPMIDEWCVDVKDLIAMPVCIIYATYSRDKFRASSVDGKRHMATLFQHIPDNVCVENLYQHARDTERGNRNRSSWRANRYETVMHSGVLEQRGFNHPKISRRQFVDNFKQASGKIEWRFNPKRHKLDQRWSRILDKRNWQSPTPEAYRNCLSAWAWGKYWWELPIDMRPPFGATKFSGLAPKMVILRKNGCDPVLCLGAAKWGFLALSLKHVPNTEWTLFDLKAEVKWSFITKPEEWRVLPFKTVGPLSLHGHAPSRFLNQVLIRQVNEGVPFLRYAFGQKVTVSFPVLKLLADHLEVRVGRSQCSRKDLLEAIAG